MPRCLLGLGGNLGDVRETFRRAAAALSAAPGVSSVRVSRLYRSAAVPDGAGGAFWNAAAEIETSLPPLDLLDRLLSIEASLGRTRETHWGPRTLDLDLLLYGGAVIHDPRLRVPHPHCWHRRFVLDPLVELAGEIAHPERHLTFAELRMRLLVRPLRVALAGGDRAARLDAIARLAERFPETTISDAGDAEDFPAAGVSRDSKSDIDPLSLLATLPLEKRLDAPALVLWIGPPGEFAALPEVSRVDLASLADSPVVAARYVLEGALGAPEVV